MPLSISSYSSSQFYKIRYYRKLFCEPMTISTLKMGTCDILLNCNYYERFRKREIAVYLVCVIWRHTMIIIEAIIVFNCVTLPMFLWFMIFFPASSLVFNFTYTYPILFLLLPCFSFSPSFLLLFFSSSPRRCQWPSLASPERRARRSRWGE